MNALASMRHLAPRCGPGTFEVAFNRVNPEAVNWIRDHAAKLVVAVGDQTRQAIRDIVERGFKEGRTAKQMARDIRQVVGLTPAHARAVDRLRVDLAAQGLSPKVIEARARAYADRLHRYRANNIARTETIRAANEGQRQLWMQAQKDGLLAKDVKREWIATPDDRLCPICQGMDGQLRLVEEGFDTGFGTVMGPPAHPSCRCAMGIEAGPRPLALPVVRPAPAPAAPGAPVARRRPAPRPKAPPKPPIARIAPVRPVAPRPVPPVVAAPRPVPPQPVFAPQAPQAPFRPPQPAIPVAQPQAAPVATPVGETEAAKARRVMSSGAVKSSKSLGVSLNDVQRTVFTHNGDEVTGYWKPGTPKGSEASFVRGRIGNAGGTQADREVLAGAVDEVLGTDLVPTVIYRDKNGVPGSSMVGVPGDQIAQVNRLQVAAVDRDQMVDLSFFDGILGNTDRHGGNALIDGRDVWAIDNGLTFTPNGIDTMRQEVVTNWWRSGAVKGPSGPLGPTRLTKEETERWTRRLTDPRLREVIERSPLSRAGKDAAYKRISDLLEVVRQDSAYGSWAEYIERRNYDWYDQLQRRRGQGVRY